jgi:SAM-dependent methyltransferase
MLKKILFNSQINVDDPSITILRKKIIKKKKILKKIYEDWYKKIQINLPYGLLKSISKNKLDVIELGSGGGFFKEFYPNVITSDLFIIPEIDIIADACKLPFKDKSLDAIVMTNVFHHIRNVNTFLNEAIRCLRKNGCILMVEPWYSPWSEFIYKNFHSEPFDRLAKWELPLKGPLSTANQALPWIVFERDINIFQSKYSNLQIKKIELIMPLSYIISGGLSFSSLMPGFLYKFIRFIENFNFLKKNSMFAFIKLIRV